MILNLANDVGKPKVTHRYCRYQRHLTSIWLLLFQGPGIMQAGSQSGLTGGLYFSELVEANLFPLHLSQHKVTSGLEVI